MIKIGAEPFLECSSKGDKRFSAFYARIKAKGNKSIEELYQAAKVFADGATNLTPRKAKGKKAINMPEVSELYDRLWVEYLNENPKYVNDLLKYNGYSDMFGKPNCQCQAISIYKIINAIKGGMQ